MMFSRGTPHANRGFLPDLWRSVKWALVIFPLSFVVLFGNYFLHRVETERYEVVRPITILSVTPEGGGVRIVAETDKLRDCNWRKTIWYFGDRAGQNVLLTEYPHRDKPQINSVGHVQWDNIWLPIDEGSVGETFADAYHQCYFPFSWWTRSEFYNGKQ